MSDSFINGNSVEDIKAYMLQPVPITRQNAIITYHESPDPREIPLPPRKWLIEQRRTQEEAIKKQIQKKIYNLIKSYPGRFNQLKIKDLIEDSFSLTEITHYACCELIKKGYIREISNDDCSHYGPLITSKPFT